MHKLKITVVKVNSGSGNDMLPAGTKPLPESVLTYHQITWSAWYGDYNNAFRIQI